MKNTLKLLLENMGVELELTTENLVWLKEHLAEKHKNHRDFPEAIHLIDYCIKINNRQ